MPGMDLPNPGGAMKKLSLEFADAQDAAAAQQQPQIPPGAGIPPAGMQGAPPAGMQPPQPDPMQGMDPSQGAQGGIFDSLGGGAQGFGQGPDSSMFTDDQLAQMVQDDPASMEGGMMNDQLMDPGTDPQMQQQLQLQMMEAARRRMGSF